MFIHYLKIALRNIRKYALQNTVSILGLAAGFVCLSLSALWIHFEESFDTFHKDADRIFTFSCFYDDQGLEFHEGIVSYYDLENLSKYPEIEEMTKYVFRKHDEENLTEIWIDTIFRNIFDLPIISGNDAFMRDDSYIAISSTYADKAFHGQDPIGQELLGKTISAVVRDFDKRSVIQFDVLSKYDFKATIRDASGNLMSKLTDADLSPKMFVKLYKGTDSDKFAEKVRNHLNTYESYHYELLPIQSMHRQVAKADMYVSYAHAKVFSLFCLLLMLCAITNFLLFSLNGIRTRHREMALRTVNGATGPSLVKMLVTEQGLILTISMISGLLLVQFTKKQFISMADIQMSGGYVTLGSMIIMILVLAVSLVISICAVRILRQRTMHSSMTSRLNVRFRMVSIGIQVFVSVLFLYVVTAMVLQFNFLRNNDWGVRINDIAVLSISNPVNVNTGYHGRPNYYPPSDDDEEDKPRKDQYIREFGNEYLERLEGQSGLTKRLGSLPYVTKLYRNFGDIEMMLMESESLKEALVNDRDNMDVRVLDILEPYKIEMLNLNIIDGSLPDRPWQRDEIIITENLRRELGLADISDGPTLTVGWKDRRPRYFIDANGQVQIEQSDSNIKYYTFNVIAVISDIYPHRFDGESGMYILCTPGNRRLIASRGSSGWTTAQMTLSYEHGMKSALKNDVTGIMDENGLEYELTFPEDRFFENLTGEVHLKNMMMVLGIICILIAVFGIYSIIVLACRERRREIAVRKVHGAKVRDILEIFGREYGATIILAAIVALGIGYIYIQHWIQQYERQVTISWWCYAIILVTIMLVVFLTVGHQILKTARENPADVIKSE